MQLSGRGSPCLVHKVPSTNKVKHGVVCAQAEAEVGGPESASADLIIQGQPGPNETVSQKQKPTNLWPVYADS